MVSIEEGDNGGFLQSTAGGSDVGNLSADGLYAGDEESVSEAGKITFVDQMIMTPKRGAKVRLLVDVRTLGGVRFRKGLVMEILSTDREYSLYVSVRAKARYLSLQKQDYPRYFEVIEQGPEEVGS